MAVDIEDLVVSATILDGRDARLDGHESYMLDEPERERLRADLVATCVEEVLRILQRRAER